MCTWEGLNAGAGACNLAGKFTTWWLLKWRIIIVVVVCYCMTTHSLNRLIILKTPTAMFKMPKGALPNHFWKKLTSWCFRGEGVRAVTFTSYNSLNAWFFCRFLMLLFFSCGGGGDLKLMTFNFSKNSLEAPPQSFCLRREGAHPPPVPTPYGKQARLRRGLPTSHCNLRFKWAAYGPALIHQWAWQ